LTERAQQWATVSIAAIPAQIAGFFGPWSTSRAAYPLGYLPSLDGARGLMTLGVLTAHTRMALFPGAIIYMDIFFAMSGYLITSLLIADYQKRGTISLKKFYVRRFLRLYPALATMVAAFVIVCWLFSSELQLRLIEAAVTFFYLMDYWRPFVGTGVYYTGHTWSLAVEEQFYLLWPITFIVLLRLWGLSWRTASIIFAIAGAFWLWRIWLTYNGASVARLYDCFDTRADSLLAGCGLAVVLKIIDIASYPRLSKILAQSLLPLAVAGFAVGFFIRNDMRWYYYFTPLFGAIPGIIVVAGLLQPNRTFMHRVFEHPVPVFCGRICYGLYIWHFPIFSWVVTWASPRYIITFLVGWPLTFAVATASYFLVERRFMRVRPV
jgi:peptidoglycan/LPS O-acetylase OafA/YrhL